MNEFAERMIRESSVPLSDGGDSHFHPWENGRGVTVSTRLPDGVDFHENLRVRNIMGGGEARPDALRSLPW